MRLTDLQKISTAIAANLPGWKSLAPADYVATPVTGGLTNVLTRIEPVYASPKRAKVADDAPVIALIREYGSATASFMKRSQEDRIVHVLSASALAPTLYASFEWGRVERYVPNARTLTTKEFGSAKFVPKVAELLGKFHALSPKLLPLCSSPGAYSVLEERLLQWTQVATKTSFPSDVLKSRKLHALGVDLFPAEIDWLVHILVPTVSSPVMFCHCDVQEGNILLGTDGLHLIDYEYSDRMERGFDLGNAFCEMSMTYAVDSLPGFCLNPDDMPSLEIQNAFFNAYARGAGLDPTSDLLASLQREAQVFALVSHLHWSIWSICMASHSEHATFDYLEYASQRLVQYYALKARALLPSSSQR